MFALPQQCTVDRHSVAARLKDKRIRAYRYPPWDVFDMCMYGTKSYLIVDNVTLDDDGEYLFSMAVVNNFIPSASDTTTSTIHVSIGKSCLYVKRCPLSRYFFPTLQTMIYQQLLQMFLTVIVPQLVGVRMHCIAL